MWFQYVQLSIHPLASPPGKSLSEKVSAVIRAITMPEQSLPQNTCCFLMINHSNFLYLYQLAKKI